MRTSMFFYVLFILLFNNTLEANPGRDDNYAQVEAYSGHPMLKPLQQAADHLVDTLDQWMAVASNAPNPLNNAVERNYWSGVVMNQGHPFPAEQRFLDTLSPLAANVHKALNRLEQEMLKGAGMQSTDRRTVDRPFHEAQAKFYQDRLDWFESVSSAFDAPLRGTVCDLLRKSRDYWQLRYGEMASDREIFSSGVCSSLWKWMGIETLALASEQDGCLLSVSPDQKPFYAQLVRYMDSGYCVLSVTGSFLGDEAKITDSESMLKAAQARLQFVSNKGRYVANDVAIETHYHLIQKILAATNADEIAQCLKNTSETHHSLKKGSVRFSVSQSALLCKPLIRWRYYQSLLDQYNARISQGSSFDERNSIWYELKRNFINLPYSERRPFYLTKNEGQYIQGLLSCMHFQQ